MAYIECVEYGILKENLSNLGKGDNLVALENRDVVFSWSSGFATFDVSHYNPNKEYLKNGNFF